MKDSVKAVRYTCDGCNSVQLVEVKDEAPPGYYINVSHIHGGGGDGGEVYACERKCILQAIDNAGVDPERR